MKVARTVWMGGERGRVSSEKNMKHRYVHWRKKSFLYPYSSINYYEVKRGQLASQASQKLRLFHQPQFGQILFITNRESVLTAQATAQLSAKTPNHVHPPQVNQAVSFNAIKNQVIALFYTEENSAGLLNKLTQLFLTNPSCIRRQRPVERHQRSSTQRLNYHRRIKKIGF